MPTVARERPADSVVPDPAHPAARRLAPRRRAAVGDRGDHPRAGAGAGVVASVDLRRADQVALALLGHLGRQRALLGAPGPGGLRPRRARGHSPRHLRGLESPRGAPGGSLDPAPAPGAHHGLAALRHRRLRHLRRQRPLPDRARLLLPHRGQHLPRRARHESPAPPCRAHAGGG